MSERIDQDLAGNPEPDLRPLSNEEKSQVDANPDPSPFLDANAWEPSIPSSTLERAGIEGNTWLQQYHQKTKSDRLIQFKQKWIHYCVKKYISFAFPYRLTRNRFTAQRINTTIDYQDVLYYAALHPHTIAGFSERRDKEGNIKHVYQYLEKYTIENEPGIVYCRRIMDARGMIIQSATTPIENPVTPDHKEVVPTAEEGREIKESADKAASETKDLQPKPRPQRTASQRREEQAARRAQPDHDPQNPAATEDREAVYTGGYGSLTWGYTLTDGSTGFLDRPTSKNIGKMIGSLELSNSGSNNVTVTRTQWTDVTNLAVQYGFYDTKNDPGKQRYIYRLKINQGQNITPVPPPRDPERGNGQNIEGVVPFERLAQIYLGAQSYENRIEALGSTRGNLEAIRTKAAIRQEQLDYYRSHGIAGLRKKYVGNAPNQVVAYSYVRANDQFGTPIEVREPTRTPDEERRARRALPGDRTYFLEKRVKTESALDDIPPAQRDEEANGTRTATEAVNFDDWKTNVPKEKGEIFAYFNPRMPLNGDGSYWAVGTATDSIITKDDFEQQRDAERLRFYNAICRRFDKPEVEEIPQAIDYSFIANFPERPNSQASMRFFITKDDFLDASQDQNTSLDVLTITRAIKASNERSKKKISHSLKELEDIGKKVDKVLSEYQRIINGRSFSNRGKKEAQIGMKALHTEANKVKNFHRRMRDYLEEQKIEFTDDDQIEICLTDDFKMLHIIHKSKVYFSGFYRDTIDNEIGVSFNLQNEQFPRQLLSGRKIISRSYNQTTFGYLYFAEEIIKEHSKIGKRDLMPWVKFLQLYTFPVPEIKPDQAKPLQDTDEEGPSDIEPIVSGDGVATGQGVTNSLEPRSVTEGSLVAYEADPEKEERESARASRVKNMETKAQDAVLNCDNLPELAKQIKSIEDIFDIVLDRLTLLELFGELANKSMQDLKKNFALLDLVEGFSPEGANGFSNRFNQFVDQELSCVMDFVGKSLVEELFNGAKLEDLDINNLEDIINSERVQDYFGIELPFIPIMGLMDFIRKIVKESLEKALTQVLLALVLEGLESYLGCDDLPGSLPNDIASRLPDPTKALDYGAKKLNDLLKEQGVDLEAIANKFNTTLENIENFMEVLSSTLNAAEIRSLLEGDPGPLLLAIVEEIMERFGLDPDEGKNTFREIGQSIPRDVLLDFVPEKYYVEFCDERDFINAAQVSRDLLRDKGLTDEDQKSQAQDNIDAAAEKLKSLCDIKSLAEDSLSSALANIEAPSVVKDIQQSSESALKSSANNSMFREAEKFMLASSKQGGFFSGGDRVDCVTMGDENEQTKVVIGSSNPQQPQDREKIRYLDQIGQYALGDLQLYIGEQDETEFDKPNKIMIYRRGVDLQQMLDNPNLAQDNRNVLVNLTLPALIDGQDVENYGGRTREAVDLLPSWRADIHTQLVHGLSVNRNQIVGSFSKADAILRPPTEQEIGSYPKPFLDKTVYDKGDGLEFLNAAFSFGFGQAKPSKSSRQSYIESPLFDIETAYNILYAPIEDAPTLINAGPNFEKKTKRTNMLVGLSARIYPYFCSIWPIFSDSRTERGFRNTFSGGRIQFPASDIENPDLIMRKMVVNYLARKVRFDLEDERLDEVYNKVIQEDYSLEEVIDAIVEPLFSDPVSNSQNILNQSPRANYRAMFTQYFDLVPRQSKTTVLQSALRLAESGQLPARQLGEAEVDYLVRIFARSAPDSVYSPTQALCAMATIYLDASTNIDSLVGTTFSSTKNSADTILKKMVSLSEGSFK